MTARAIGAAVVPPTPLWFSSTTAMATCGGLRRPPAKAMNQVVFEPSMPVSAVPVLPPTVMPGICAAVPVPLADDEPHHRGDLVRRLAC